MPYRAVTFIFFALVSAGLAAQPVTYQREDQGHWATAAFFGTGWYRIDDKREAFIMRIPPRQALRESGWNADGTRRIGLELLYPVTLGLHQLDDVPDFIEFDNYGTISFTPGVELEIPVSARWWLRPYAHLGLGYERQSGEWAGIAYGGVKSRYRLGENEDATWSLLNAVTWAGFNPQSGSGEQYASAMAGFEFSRALGEAGPGRGSARLNGHLTYSWLFDELRFGTDGVDPVSISDEWELGLAFGRGAEGVNIGFLSFEQIGLAFKFSSNGDYRALALNLRSPFTL